MAIYDGDRILFARAVLKDFLTTNAASTDVEAAMSIINAVDTILNFEEKKNEADTF